MNSSTLSEAKYYEPVDQGVRCRLCPKGCFIGEGQSGFCRVRKNMGGRLYTQNYAACTAMALDPIEKKPLYHFYPGSAILSLGTWGCNFSCQFCQNWQIAQATPEFREVTPLEAVRLAADCRKQGNIGIAYTYSEPSVWFEYVLDTAVEVNKAGMKNVLITNGFIEEEPLKEALPYLDAMNIDVKAFTETYYKKVCAGSLEHVKKTVEAAVACCHVEITTLLVPGMNDEKEEVTQLCRWLAGIRRDIPLHFSRYFPNYHFKKPPTPLETMSMAYETAKEYLDYVYLGNMGGAGSNTYCPSCGECVIDRVEGFIRLAEKNRCQHCGYKIAILGEAGK